jgi:hypothetical protein
VFEELDFKIKDCRKALATEPEKPREDKFGDKFGDKVVKH